MRSPAEWIEMNPFVGREFLLWLWFESEVFETNLKIPGGETCVLWFENQVTLASDGEETRVKGPLAATAAEAKQALRKGKLPREAKVRAVVDAQEFSWSWKADELFVSGLKLPALLTEERDIDEAFYERMRLLETLEGALTALFRIFMALRLGDAWGHHVVPLMRLWVRGLLGETQTPENAAALAAYGALRAKKKSPR